MTKKTRKAPARTRTPAAKEIIVDEASKEALNFLRDEPVLGLLAREFFEVETEQGNLPGGPAHPRWTALEPRWRALDDAISHRRATTLGGLAWRLAQLMNSPWEDENISPWYKEMVEAAFADVKALMQAQEGADEKILTLFRQWREALRLANASHEDDGGGLDAEVWAIERQLYDTPATSAVGLAVKAYMVAFTHAEEQREFVAFDPHYADDGTLQLDLYSIKSIVEDAARFVPELVPLVSSIAGIPTLRPPESYRIANLRARAEALADEYDARLPEGDAGLIEAERRFQELDPRREALSDGIEITQEIEAITDLAFNAMCRLDKTVATTPATTLAGAAVKLRRLLHPELGMEGGDGEHDLPSLRHVLSVIEREAARPARSVEPSALNDPIISLIAEHERLWTEVSRLTDAVEALAPGAANTAALERQKARTLGAAVASSKRVRQTRATTLAGLVAKLEWAEGTPDRLESTADDLRAMIEAQKI